MSSYSRSATLTRRSATREKPFKEGEMLGTLRLLKILSFGEPRAPTLPAASVHPTQYGPPGFRAFRQLQDLVGSWRGHRPDGRALEVNYRLSAGGSLLVETWVLGPGHEALTLYHMDGNSLLASHYCPEGNQPRLIMSHSSAHRFDFKFRDATGLKPGDPFQHAFWIDIISPEKMTRSETYIECHSPSTETITYTRVGD